LGVILKRLADDNQNEVKQSAGGNWSRQATGLIRELGPYDVLMFAFVLPSIIYVGHYMLFSAGLYPGSDFFLGSIFIFSFIPLSIIYILFTVAMPRSGGEYVYGSRIISPGWGFFAGWALLVAGPFSSSVSISIPAITYGLGEMFAVWGVETGSKSSFNTGVALTQHAGIPGFALMVIFWVGCFAIASIGMRVIRWTVWVTGLLQWGALIVYVAIVATTNFSTVSANMLAETGVSYQTLVNTVSSVGYAPNLYSYSETAFAGFTYVALAVFGWTFVSNVAGEIKSRSMVRSMIFGQVGSLCLLALFTALFAGATYLGYTRNFVNALGFLAASGKDVGLFGVPMGMSFAVAFATRNPYLAIVPGLGYVVASIGIAVTFAAMATRNLFAMSFDGLLPSAMSKVSSGGSPRIATVVALIPGLLFLAVGQFTNYLNLFAYLVILWFAAYLLVAIAAVAFPYRRKDLFQSSPSIVQKKVAGIPLIVIMGIITIVECIAGIYTVVSPAVSSGFVSLGPLLDSTLIPLGLGWVIYGIAYWYNKSKHTPIALRFKEIPPE
jgi:amino acid transporter